MDNKDQIRLKLIWTQVIRLQDAKQYKKSKDLRKIYITEYNLIKAKYSSVS